MSNVVGLMLVVTLCLGVVHVFEPFVALCLAGGAIGYLINKAYSRTQ